MEEEEEEEKVEKKIFQIIYFLFLNPFFRIPASKNRKTKVVQNLGNTAMYFVRTFTRINPQFTISHFPKGSTFLHAVIVKNFLKVFFEETVETEIVSRGQAILEIAHVPKIPLPPSSPPSFFPLLVTFARILHHFSKDFYSILVRSYSMRVTFTLD